MIKAVLLDLDNTLLHNLDSEFAAAFRLRFERCLADCCGIERGQAGLRLGMRAIYEARDGKATNADVARRGLAAALSLSTDAATSALESFYASSYQELQSLTAPVARAGELVACLLGQDLLVAIATNPLYPESAIRQRLAWAGLGGFLEDFAFITHSENMRFAKPDPAYYAETIARVGVEPDEALMVGDHETNDIGPARSLGIHTWPIAEENKLASLFEHVHQADWRNAYLPRQLTPDMIQPQYMGNIAALHGLLSEVKEHQWLQRPDPEEWSILQILCHLWQAETKVHQPRLRRILKEDDPFIASLPAPGPDIPPCHHDGHEIMDWFWRERRRTIKMLADLEQAAWERPARHSIFGLTNLLEMAHFTAQHDRLHISQLCQTLGKCADWNGADAIEPSASDPAAD